MARERRPLQLLLPDVALVLGRAETAEIGPHAPSLARLQDLGPLAAPARALALHVLDPTRARPPGRQAVGVGDEAPDLWHGGRDRSPAGDAGHSDGPSSYSPARRRRSLTSSRCLRWLTVAARPSTLCRASLRGSGPSSAPSSCASRSAEERKTRRLRAPTPTRESSLAARTISRSVSS